MALSPVRVAQMEEYFAYTLACTEVAQGSKPCLNNAL